MISTQIAKAVTSVVGRDLSLVQKKGPHLTDHATQRTQERQIPDDEVRWVFSHGDRYNLPDNASRQMIIHRDKSIGVIVNRQTNTIITVIPDVKLEIWLDKRKKKARPRAKKDTQQTVGTELEVPPSEIKESETDPKASSVDVTLDPRDAWKECGYCKAKGHLIKECMAFYDPEKCELQLAKRRNQTECRYCHKNTHWIKNCPKLKRKALEEKKKASRENGIQQLQKSLSSIGYTMVDQK